MLISRSKKIFLVLALSISLVTQLFGSNQVGFRNEEPFQYDQVLPLSEFSTYLGIVQHQDGFDDKIGAYRDGVDDDGNDILFIEDELYETLSSVCREHCICKKICVKWDRNIPLPRSQFDESDFERVCTRWEEKCGNCENPIEPKLPPLPLPDPYPIPRIK
jgi:hypothetical protein